MAQQNEHVCHITYPVAVVHNFYIYDEIGRLKDYTDLISTLDTASENELINIYINTPGGLLDTAISIIHAMIRTQAQLCTHADGEVASAGTLLFFASQNKTVHNFSTFMFHDASSGFLGKLSESKKNLAATIELVERLMYDLLDPYFEKEEITTILSGQDYYCNSDEMVDRLTKGEKILDQRHKAKEKSKKKKSSSKSKQ